MLSLSLVYLSMYIFNRIILNYLLDGFLPNKSVLSSSKGRVKYKLSLHHAINASMYSCLRILFFFRNYLNFYVVTINVQLKKPCSWLHYNTKFDLGKKEHIFKISRTTCLLAILIIIIVVVAAAVAAVVNSCIIQQCNSRLSV